MLKIERDSPADPSPAIATPPTHSSIAASTALTPHTRSRVQDLPQPGHTKLVGLAHMRSAGWPDAQKPVRQVVEDVQIDGLHVFTSKKNCAHWHKYVSVLNVACKLCVSNNI